MALHINDAGKKTRNLESYVKQMELVKENEAFFVKAKILLPEKLMGCY